MKKLHLCWKNQETPTENIRKLKKRGVHDIWVILKSSIAYDTKFLDCMDKRKITAMGLIILNEINKLTRP